MGVLNVTPDSFSDGGESATPIPAFERARVRQAEGPSLPATGRQPPPPPGPG